MGWSPVYAAQALGSSKTMTVGFAPSRAEDGIQNDSFMMQFMAGIHQSLSRHGYGLLFRPCTSDKEAINRIARVIYEKGFLLVSYDMKRLGHQEKDEYVVSIVLKARKNTEESPLLLLMEQFPEVTVERIE